MREVACATLLLLGCGAAPEAPPPEALSPVAKGGIAPVAKAPVLSGTPSAPGPPATLTLLAGGDLIPHVAVVDSAERHGWDSLLAPLAETLRAADLAILNLETPIAPVRDGPTGPMMFNAPVALLDALRGAGVDAVSQANNHATDQGRTGLLETLGHLDRSGIAHAGTGATCGDARAPVLLRKNGFTLGWISSTRLQNANINRGEGAPCVFVFSVAAVRRSAEEARRQGAELVVLSLHWGQEYETRPRNWDRSFARELVAAGVDVILGHHPHVLQEVAWVEAGGREGLVAYSLGNLLSAQGWQGGPRHAPRRDGALLELTLARRDGDVHVRDVRALPTSSEHGARSCGGAPARVRAELLREAHREAAGDPRLAGCAARYRSRYDAVSRALGQLPGLVAPWED